MATITLTETATHTQITEPMQRTLPPSRPWWLTAMCALSVSLSVLLSVVLFVSIGASSGLAWSVLFALVGLTLSAAQFALPRQIIALHKQGQSGAVACCALLLACLQMVSLAASVGGLGAAFGGTTAAAAAAGENRAVLVRQIQQEQARIDTLLRYDRASAAAPIQNRLDSLRGELAALPEAKPNSAAAVIGTLATIAGTTTERATTAAYLVISVLLDACAMFFLLLAPVATASAAEQGPGPRSARTVESCETSETTITGEATKYPQLVPALIEGSCKASVRAVRDFCGVGTRQAAQILESLAESELLMRTKSNRYQVNTNARCAAA